MNNVKIDRIFSIRNRIHSSLCHVSDLKTISCDFRQCNCNHESPKNLKGIVNFNRTFIYIHKFTVFLIKCFHLTWIWPHRTQSVTYFHSLPEHCRDVFKIFKTPSATIGKLPTPKTLNTQFKLTEKTNKPNEFPPKVFFSFENVSLELPNCIL